MFQLLLPLLLAVPLPQKPEIPPDTEVKTTASGLKYSVLEPGDQQGTPKPGAMVKVNYTGWLTDGTMFDSSVGKQPFQFNVGVGKVIKGWDEGVQLMSKGARYKFTIPPELGYGERGSGSRIPPNSTLIFEVELLDFQKLPELPAADPARQKKTPSGIVYELLEQGGGAPAKPGEKVNMRFSLWNPQGKLLQSTAVNNAMIGGEVGQMPFAFLNELAPLIPRGSKVRVEVPPELAWKDRDMGPDLPPNSRTTWVLELVEPLPVPPFPGADTSKLQKTASGLAYEVLEAGSGAKPTGNQKVRVHYAGWTTDGKLFDSSYDRGEPAEFGLRQVIRGWTEGLQLMQEGATYRFVIPPELGYGVAGSPPAIPPNATLVFQVKLLEILE